MAAILAVLMVFLHPVFDTATASLLKQGTLGESGLIGKIVPNWKAGSGAGWQLVIALVYGFVWDFFQYWAHRLQHVSPQLWPFHRVHHSDPDVNASTAVRQSLGHYFISFSLIGLPTLIVCGVNVLDVASATVLFAGWGYFNHANIRLHLGPLTPVFSGPQLHRIHHGIAPDYHNRNFAAFFPVLDVMFGTYRAPRVDEYPETGVDDGLGFAAPEFEVFSPALQSRVAVVGWAKHALGRPQAGPERSVPAIFSGRRQWWARRQAAPLPTLRVSK
jgi:sterol desaturase/sphingolipid hydroxylase (fatty acid hydroxylase superfamily)